MKGLISEIQKSSVHDGPGLRTVVFLKGCNMRCAWCHNPETVYPGEEILLSPDKCIGCGECEKGCFAGARVTWGTWMETEQILAVIAEDKAYYGENGGVTISGGEPLCQPEIVKDLLMRCGAEGIHTALETNLSRDQELVLDVCGRADMIMCDCKCYDEETHIRYTGITNRNIMSNLQAIDRLKIPILVRTPVITGINDTEEEITRIVEFLSGLEHLWGYELLTYHPLGQYKPVSVHFQTETFEMPSKVRMTALAYTAGKSGLPIYMDNVPIKEGVGENADL